MPIQSRFFFISRWRSLASYGAADAGGVVLSVGIFWGYAGLYSEGGGILLIPNKEFSDDIGFGGYGLFGFEFFTHPKSPVTYYLQAGGVGSSGDAEKLDGNPIYSNGFVIEIGVRWYPY